MALTLPPKLGATWDASKQDGWRQKHPDQAIIMHFLLDASPSMIGHAATLRTACNLYMGWLKAHLSPMSQGEVSVFSIPLTRGTRVPISQLPAITTENYQPEKGTGTDLYNAVGDLLDDPPGPGQHVLVLFTDGGDCADNTRWTAARVKQRLTTLQDKDGWLCVYLGAYPDALAEGEAMGFHPGNCLVCHTDRIPQAFKDLQEATQKYLKATPAERKLLTQGGVFV